MHCRSKCKMRNYKAFGRRHKGKSLWLGVKEFSEMIPKAQSIKEKIDKLDLIEIKGFCYVKATVKRLIIQATDGE